MTTRADVTRLRSANSRLVDLARADLRQAFGSLNLSRPEAVRDELLEIVPALTREYGDVAATVAAEWYEQIRSGQVGGTYTARLGSQIADAAPESSVKYAAGHLFTEKPEQTLALLTGSLQRHVLYSGRDTVARNVALDPAKPRYARVTSGKTCAWCSMLASRGFVYHDQAAAGATDDFHDDCNCSITPEFDREQHHIEGYDPDDLYDKYQRARAESGSHKPNDIAASLRRLYPEDFTDGVHEH